MISCVFCWSLIAGRWSRYGFHTKLEDPRLTCIRFSYQQAGMRRLARCNEPDLAFCGCRASLTWSLPKLRQVLDVQESNTGYGAVVTVPRACWLLCSWTLPPRKKLCFDFGVSFMLSDIYSWFGVFALQAGRAPALAGRRFWKWVWTSRHRGCFSWVRL